MEIKYTRQGDYLIPNLYLEKMIIVEELANMEY